MNLKRKIVSIVIGLLLVFTWNIGAFAAQVSNRLGGDDRYRTAVEVSKAGWAVAQNVVLVTGEDYPDALCAVPLAKKLDAPILLTGKAALNAYTEGEISRLGARYVYIIGGQAVVSENVKKALESKGLTCKRLWGNDRYETSVEVAKYLDANFAMSREIAVVTGEGFADALSISPVAAAKAMPVILVPKDAVPSSIKSYIGSRQIERTHVMGGTDIISDGVSRQFPYSERILGYDKYERNIAAASKFSSYINYDTVYVASGNDYPDALAGSALAAKNSSMIMLTSGVNSYTQKNFINSKASSIKYIKALGGEAVVSSTSLQDLLMSAVGDKVLKIHFINVGHGDSILVQAPNGKNMLIDAGDNDKGREVVSYLRSQGVSKIDVLVGTHPHNDHIGGIDTVIYNLPVEKFYMPSKSSTLQAYEDVEKAAQSKSLTISSVYRGMKIDLDSSVDVQVLAPCSYNYDDTNDYSIVLRLTYGNNSFLLTGDAGFKSEDEMVGSSYTLHSDVLKIGNHGSSYAASDYFLNSVNPKYAVLSVGRGNDYGYPSKETMERLKYRNIPLYRTDECGTIVCTSDGSNMVFNTSPGSYSHYVDGVSNVSVSSSVDNAAPARNSTVNLTVNGPSGGTVTAMCRFKGQDVKYTGTIGTDGKAVIPVQVGEALPGYTVYIDILVEINSGSSGKGIYFSQTKFTPQ